MARRERYTHGMSVGERTEKRCPICKTTKSVDSFHADKNSSDGRHGYCSQCKNENARKYRKELPPGKKKNFDLKYSYNMTIEEYENILKEQNYRCAICDREAEGHHAKSDFLFVDHCHKNGAIRGLLCHKCNSGLGCFNDDTELLISAIIYLDKNTNPQLKTTAVNLHEYVG